VKQASADRSRRHYAWLIPATVMALAVAALFWRERIRELIDPVDAGRLGEQRQQIAEILPVRPAQLPRLAPREAFTRSLARSFTEWQPPLEPSGHYDPAATAAALAEARRNLDSAGKQNDFDALLDAAVSPRQLFWVVEQALSANNTRFLDPADGRRIMTRLRGLTGEAAGDVLRVEVSMLIRAVSIPDPAKDEIRLDLTIDAGAPVDRVIRHMAANKMIDPRDGPALAARWRRADAAIGETESERQNLAKCLGLSFTDAVEQTELAVFYNVGPASGYIWRGAAMTVHYPAHFDTTRYPFDTTLFTVMFGATTSLDSSKLSLAPYALAGAPLEPRLSSPPRGFQFLRQTPSLVPVAVQDNSNSLPRPALVYVFQLSRQLDTAIWRTFIPLLLIVIFTFAATLRALTTHENINSIMTSLLPTLTVASVALQLTASTAIPGNAGGTVMDKIFVSIYLQFFFLFFALNTHHLKKTSRVMLAGSVAAFMYGVHFFF
jgi:hypothetical protein